MSKRKRQTRKPRAAASAMTRTLKKPKKKRKTGGAHRNESPLGDRMKDYEGTVIDRRGTRTVGGGKRRK